MIENIKKRPNILLIFVRYSFIMKSICYEGEKAMGELVAVLSGKGGTGKTSVCAGVATALAELGARVLCIDCDVGLRNLDISLGLSDSASLSFLDILSGNYTFDQIQPHPQFPHLFFLTAPVNATAGEVDPSAFASMLQQAREKFSYVFLDAPAGIDAGFRLAAQYADRIILVTGADPAAVRDAARAGQLLEHMGKTNARIIVNRVAKKMVASMSVTVDDVMDDTGLPLLGLVPEDANVTLAAAFGKPLLKMTKRGAAKACRSIAKRIQGLPEPLSIR